MFSPPDYDVPSPSAEDHMELELPDEHDDGHNRSSNIIEVNQPPSIRTQDIPRPPSPSSSNRNRQHSTSSNGDLNSRLDSMMGANVIPGLSDPRDVDLRNNSSKNSGSASGRTLSSKAASSNYSISEFLTKLASGEDVDVEEFTKSKVPPASASNPNRSVVAASQGGRAEEGGGSGQGWWGRSGDERGWNRQVSMHSEASSSSYNPGGGGAEPSTASPTEDWPPPHKEWPEPRPDPSVAAAGGEGQANAGSFVHTGWNAAAGAVEGGEISEAGGGTPLEDEGPTPEWQIRPEDLEPEESAQLPENDQVYSDNIALARLNKKPPPANAVPGGPATAVAAGGEGENLISLTDRSRPPPLMDMRLDQPPPPPPSGAATQGRHGIRRSEDMDVESDEEHHPHLQQQTQHQLQQQQQPHQQQQQPFTNFPPPNLMNQPPPNAGPNSFENGGPGSGGPPPNAQGGETNNDGRPSLQDRLRSLAGVPLPSGPPPNSGGGFGQSDQQQQQQGQDQQQQQQGGGWIPVSGPPPGHPPPPHNGGGGGEVGFDGPPQPPPNFMGGAPPPAPGRNPFRMRLPGPYPGGRGGGGGGRGGGPPPGGDFGGPRPPMNSRGRGGRGGFPPTRGMRGPRRGGGPRW